MTLLLLLRALPRPLLLPVLATAVAAAPVAAQWVGFGDNAWPAGNCASDRGTVGPGLPGEVFVRLDAHEHGGWGTGGGAGFRTIDGVQFMAHDVLGPPSIVRITLYPEDPFVNHMPDLAPASAIAFGFAIVPPGPCPVLITVPGPPTPVPCANNGDIFVGFSFLAFDGIQLGRIDSGTLPGFDVPGVAYIGGVGYPLPIPPSHRLERTGLLTAAYLPGPSQYFIDVSQGLGLVDGVGGTMTSQLSFPNSVPLPGTSNFLSGSYPDCTSLLGTRTGAPLEFLTMKARAPWAIAGSVAVFVVALNPIVPCSAELPLGLLFPGGRGVLCLDPAVILLETFLPLDAFGNATVAYGPLVPALCGLGITHQAFIVEPFPFTLSGGPCDRQEF